jgi:pyrophosphatase PpaX
MPLVDEREIWLFDFDGTLVDSEAVIMASFRHATEKILGHVPPDDVLRAGIGMTLEQQARDLAGDRWRELYDVYVLHNRASHDELLRGFDGVPPMLARLRACGARLGIVTSKMRETLELGLRCTQLEPAWFEVMVAKEDTTSHKPDPGPLLHALALLGAAPEQAVYVGDSPYDLRAARAAGVAAAAAMWGGIFARDELMAEQPALVFETPAEIASEVAA